MLKKAIVIFCIFMMLFAMTGCTDRISNDEEAIAEMGNVTEEITDITSDLEEINQELGSNG